MFGGHYQSASHSIVYPSIVCSPLASSISRCPSLITTQYQPIPASTCCWSCYISTDIFAVRKAFNSPTLPSLKNFIDLQLAIVYFSDLFFLTLFCRRLSIGPTVLRLDGFNNALHIFGTVIIIFIVIYYEY